MVALGKGVYGGLGGLQQHGGNGAHWADRLTSFDSHSIFNSPYNVFTAIKRATRTTQLLDHNMTFPFSHISIILFFHLIMVLLLNSIVNFQL
jgi:hypothetical protein